MVNHGVNAGEQATSVSTPVVAESGVPFVVGTAPIQSATNPAKAGVPVLCTSWDEAVAALGYSDDWEKYTLCEVMYSHFKLFGCQPVIFCNVLDLADSDNKETVAAEDMVVTAHKIKLPIEAINDNTLVIKATGEQGDAYVLDTDYSTYYDGENLVIEFLADGSVYEAATASVAYTKVKADNVKAADVANGFEGVELCLTKIGVVPDLLLAGRFSKDATVAAVMATKAANINGILKAKALCDIDSSKAGATSYDKVLETKNKANIVDSEQIACWPMVKLGDKKFHMSTQLAGSMATIDSENEGCPYESPSNKGLKIDGLVLEDGTEVNLTLAQANTLNANGVVTALNFFNGWVAWGNYTACYPANTDVKDYFIPVSRMFKWIDNTLVKTFWKNVDDPMNRRLIDTVLDTANIWMNGLVGKGYLYGARCEMLESENPLTDLMAGKIKIHTYIAPPPPAQEIDFVTEYDVNYIQSALG